MPRSEGKYRVVIYNTRRLWVGGRISDFHIIWALRRTLDVGLEQAKHHVIKRFPREESVAFKYWTLVGNLPIQTATDLKRYLEGRGFLAEVRI